MKYQSVLCKVCSYVLLISDEGEGKATSKENVWKNKTTGH